MLDEGTPLFLQIAEQVADDIADGTLAEGTRVPSTNEFAAFYRINPATAAKGINILIDDGLLEKRRGLGMFVAAGAREQLLVTRRKQFADQYLDPLLTEAKRLGIDTENLISMIKESGHSDGSDAREATARRGQASGSPSVRRSDQNNHGSDAREATVRRGQASGSPSVRRSDQDDNEGSTS